MARLLFWLTVLAGALVTVMAWWALPDRVPLHFDAAGQADRWGSRTEAVVTTGVIVAGLALLFWALVLAVPRLPASLVNLPERDKAWWFATPERRQELNRRLVEDLHLIGAATIAVVVVIDGVTLAQARQADPSLGPWFWVLIAAYLVGVLGYSGHAVLHRYRAPRQA